MISCRALSQSRDTESLIAQGNIERKEALEDIDPFHEERTCAIVTSVASQGNGNAREKRKLLEVNGQTRNSK